MLEYSDILTAAIDEVGNWTKVSDFGWSDSPDPRYWARFELSHRDSEALDLSNAAAILESLKEVNADGDDYYEVSSSHWAVGYTDGIAVRVFRDGTHEVTTPNYGKGTGSGDAGEPGEDDVTDVFRRLYELAQALADYPILNEKDLSAREYEDMLKYCAQVRIGEVDGIEYLPANDDTIAEDLARIAFDALNATRSEDVREDGLISAAVAARVIVPDAEDVAYKLKEAHDELETVQARVSDVISDFLRGLANESDLRELAREVCNEVNAQLGI